MIDRLLYRCPLCGAEPWLKGKRCRACGAGLRVEADRTRLTIGGRTAPVAAWYDRVRELDGPPREGRRSGTVIVSEEVRAADHRGPDGLQGVHFGRRPLGPAVLRLDTDRLSVRGAATDRTIPLDRITAVTIESHTLIVDHRDGRPLFFDFADGAGKRWEDLLQRALAAHHAPHRIAEYCPRLRLAEAAPRRRTGGGGYGRLDPPSTAADRRTGFERLRRAVRGGLSGALPLTVAGRGHVPARGPCIIAANHSSFLDAILLAAFAPRPIRFMTKNSQFAHPLLVRFLPWAGAFPVRRYTTDVGAVRNVRRVLARGAVLGLFPEGERCWDGRLQPFKRTAVRLMLALGVPVVPAGIAGAYALMPRWTGRVRRGPVAIRFGPPLALARIPAGAQTPADVERAAAGLREAILALQ